MGIDSGPNATSQPPSPQRPKLWTPVFLLIVGMTLCSFIVGQGSNSGTSIYIDRMGGTAAYAGMLAAVFSVAAAVARLVCGPLIDLTGRVRIMLIGGVVMLVGTIGPAFSTEGFFFVLWRFLQGAGFSAATTASATAADDVLPHERLGEGIGYYGLGQAISMSIGPAIALYLVSTDPAENLYLGLSIAAALAILLTAFCRYEKNPMTLPPSASYRRRYEADRASEHAPSQEDPQEVVEADEPQVGAFRRVFEVRALPGTIPMLVLSPAFGFGIFFMGLLGTHMGVGSAGMFYTVSAIAMIVVRLKSGSFMDRVHPIRIMAVTMITGLIAYLMQFTVSIHLFDGIMNDILFYAAGIPYGIALGLGLPVNQSVAVKNTPPNRWGGANALFLLASDVGIGTASVIWGIVNDSFGFSVTIICVMGCIAASYLVAWIVYPANAKRRTTTFPK